MAQKRRGSHHQPHLKVISSIDGSRVESEAHLEPDPIAGRRIGVDPVRLHRWSAEGDPQPPAA